MQTLNDKLVQSKYYYREIFANTVAEIEKIIESCKPANISGNICDIYSKNSDGLIWQTNVINQLRQNFEKIKKDKIQEISHLKQKNNCINCGTCCKCAISEFSPEELLKKANSGDKNAIQFSQIFTPYKDEKEYTGIFPQYFELLKQQGIEKYHVYHCNKLTENNLCSDYEKRPQICRDFPHNPIAFLPPSCGYNKWKLSSEKTYMELNARAEITEYYITQINNAISTLQ